jgi:transposase-like protein
MSKAFKKGSKESLDEFNARNLSKLDLVSLMIDCVGFGDLTVIVVLGIDVKGKKHILGIKQAETENWEVCRDLFESLMIEALKLRIIFL